MSRAYFLIEQLQTCHDRHFQFEYRGWTAAQAVTHIQVLEDWYLKNWEFPVIVILIYRFQFCQLYGICWWFRLTCLLYIRIFARQLPYDSNYTKLTIDLWFFLKTLLLLLSKFLHTLLVFTCNFCVHCRGFNVNAFL